MESVKPRQSGLDNRSVGRLIEKRERSCNLLEKWRQRIQSQRENTRNDASRVNVKRKVEIRDRDEPQITVAAWDVKKQFRFFENYALLQNTGKIEINNAARPVFIFDASAVAEEDKAVAHRHV